jgi:hypothetical protein
MEITYQNDSKIIIRFSHRGKDYSLSQYKGRYKLLDPNQPMVFENAKEVLRYVSGK